MIKPIKLPRTIGIGFGAVLFLLFSPLVSGTTNLGTWFGCGLGAAVIALFLFLPNLHALTKRIASRKIGKWALIVLSVLLALFVLWACLLIGMMLERAAENNPPADATLLVLGCKVEGSAPGKALTQRLEAALAYLNEHPDAKCVLSGGQGSDEEISEAEAMRRYLTERGIDDARLYLEDQSHNTAQNMSGSAALIEKEGLIPVVAIVTHTYHQCRAALLAEDAGLVPYAVNAKSNLLSYPTYFLRDLLGVAYEVAFG